MMDRECAEIIRKKYPGMDAQLYSKVKHPKRYGVTLTAGAKKLLPSDAPNLRSERSKSSPDKVSLKVDKAVKEQLQVIQREAGDATIAETVARLLALAEKGAGNASD